MANGVVPFKQCINSNNSPGTDQDVSLVGFSSDALVVTIDGERPASRLRARDLVIVLAFVGYSPIEGVIETSVDLQQRPKAAPILIVKGALEERSPLRDMLVAPGCLIGLDRQLVPAAALDNGRSIRRLWDNERIRYTQLAMGRHEMVIVDGVRLATLRQGEQTCWPIIEEGPALEALKAGILARIPELEARGALDPRRASPGAEGMPLQTVGVARRGRDA